MPTNRRSDEVSQSFAIGTKIEYMNKLFEVTESDSCCDCSLATICSSSDLSAGDRNDDALSRDKRINIFGECSSLRRPDSKSVVFVEISTTKEKDVYTVGPLYKTNNELMPIKIDLPKGYVIDKEHSDLDKGIIKFKNKRLTLEQLYKSAKENHYLTNRSAIKEFRDGKLIALANLMDIARYFNGDWNYDFTKGDIGYMIVYDTTMTEPRYVVRKFDSVTNAYYGNSIFKNEADAQYVIDNPNFRNVLDRVFKV